MKSPSSLRGCLQRACLDGETFTVALEREGGLCDCGARGRSGQQSD
jgi:hypothetical protein